ncbi:MAG: ECF transporter S component [Lachnospiraceae bacterium]|nr:ECF transporter S component [Lachnospiraceae bacterium]
MNNEGKSSSLKVTDRTKWVVIVGLFMALNIVMSMSFFSIPVPGGHLYLCDLIICTAALLLDPVGAFVVGGVGSFIGDMLFYPLPMFVSLATHGLQAVVISLISHSSNKGVFKKPEVKALVATLAGAVIMVTGYTLGKIFVYSTFEYAMMKLPYEIAQALIGVIGSVLLCYKAGLAKIYRKIVEDK